MARHRHNFDDWKGLCFKLTLEYCLRRLKRCTILSKWQTHSWILCSTPLDSYPLKVHTASHSTVHIQTFTHMQKLSKHQCAHTFLAHTTSIYYTNTNEKTERVWWEKGGTERRDKDSSAVLPSTHIHSGPLSSVAFPHRHLQDAHTTWLSMHKQIQYTHYNTCTKIKTSGLTITHTRLYILTWTQHN